MRLVIVVVLGSLAVSCSSGDRSPGSLRVESGSYVTPEIGMFKSLDPDGDNLLLTGGDSLCVQPVDSTAITCVAMPDDSSVRELAGGWAPDGSRFVFHARNGSWRPRL